MKLSQYTLAETDTETIKLSISSRNNLTPGSVCWW